MCLTWSYQRATQNSSRNCPKMCYKSFWCVWLTHHSTAMQLLCAYWVRVSKTNWVCSRPLAPASSDYFNSLLVSCHSGEQARACPRSSGQMLVATRSRYKPLWNASLSGWWGRNENASCYSTAGNSVCNTLSYVHLLRSFDFLLLLTPKLKLKLLYWVPLMIIIMGVMQTSSKLRENLHERFYGRFKLNHERVCTVCIQASELVKATKILHPRVPECEIDMNTPEWVNNGPGTSLPWRTFTNKSLARCKHQRTHTYTHTYSSRMHTSWFTPVSC